MSGYTIGEIAVWLILAAILGFLLGWLLRQRKCESEHSGAERPADASIATSRTPVEAASDEPVGLADAGRKETVPAKSAAAKKAPAKTAARTSTSTTSAKKATSAPAAKKATTKKATTKKATSKAPAKKAAVASAPAAKKATSATAPAAKKATSTTAAKKATSAPAAKKATTKKAATKKSTAKKATTVTPGRFPGSAQPLAGGRAPSAAYKIKGNEDSMIYHTPDSPFYGQTVAETWFKTEAAAVAAGFRAPRNA